MTAEVPTTRIDTHHQYDAPQLDASDLLPNPLDQFKRWFASATESPSVSQPEAVCLATSTPDGRVSNRIVLLKRVDQRGFVFFTNYESRKGKELEANPRAALAFYWGALHQQVRVTGRVEKTSSLDSEDYFKGRPLGSRVGAWASPQSRPVETRDELVRKINEVEDRFGVERGSADRDTPTEADKSVLVPAPDHWGGIRVIPDELEFWVGRPSRLHDRFRYTRPDEGSPWKIERLGP